MIKRYQRSLGVSAVSLLLVVSSLSYAAGASPGQPGTPQAWGANPFGQLGDGTLAPHPSPLPVTGLTDVIGLSGGRGHVIALRADGTVWTWGSNDNGEIGNGTVVDRPTPAAVAGLANIVEVAAGHYHSMALRSDGTVWTWGLNASGQLGDGTTTRRTVPVQVSGLTGVAHIAGGRDMSYALKTDGTVWAWGLNTDGELGDGTLTSRRTPVRVGGLTNVTAIAGGRDHGLAILANGTVWSWGDNQFGQLGDGTVVDRSTPVQIPGLTNVIAVAAGAHHSVALRADGTVLAWGQNNLGQVGDGTTTTRRSPVQVSGLTGVSSIGCGRDHVLAVLSNGTVRAWGRNDFGQLGDGTTTNRTRPVTVTGLTNAVEASGGQDYSVALTVQGAPDTTPPTIPGQPSGTSTSAGRIDLTWSGSTDQSLPITYRIYRDGGASPIGQTTGTTFSDTGLVAGSTHTYAVDAVDAATNPSQLSPSSSPITVFTPPPFIFADDFSSGTLSNWTGVTRLTIDATQGSGAAPSARAQVSGQSAWAYRTLSGTLNSACMSVKVNVSSLGGTTVDLFRLRTTSDGPISRAFVSASGVLSFRSDASGVQKSSGVALGTGWHSVELCGTVGTAGAWDLYRDGVKILNAWVANTGTTPIGRIQIGDTAAKTFTVNWDDVVLDQTAG